MEGVKHREPYGFSRLIWGDSDILGPNVVDFAETEIIRFLHDVTGTDIK
jgi:hypothetical protein